MQNHDSYYDQQGFICPSFNTYSSPSAADTAARVCREFKSLGLVDEDTEYEYDQNDDVDDDDDDFEFVSFQKSGDHVMINNAIVGPVFPVFNRDLISQRDVNDAVSTTSSASSDVDELDGVPAGSYCVWMPKTTPASSPSHCKKSKSTGSTSSSNLLCRKFRLRDLLRRSKSEGGKDAFVLLTPAALTSSKSGPKKLITSNNNIIITSNNNNIITSNNNDEDHENRGHEKMAKGNSGVNGRRRSANGRSAVSMAHEVFYANKSKENNNKRQSYLPYRKDLVGFFASVSSMGRTFPTF